MINSAHLACTKAADQAQKKAGGRLDLEFYRIYEYRRGVWRGKGCHRIVTLSDGQ
jgi:hypothetical protein